MQTRTHSFLESLANIAIGAWFTVISLIRSYALRRWFTRKTEGNSG